MPQPIAISCLSPDAAAGLEGNAAAWARANRFEGQAGRLLAVPDGEGAIGSYLFGMGKDADRPPLLLGLAAASLPEGEYRLEGDLGDPLIAALGFRLGAYRFDRYTKADAPPVLAEIPEGCDGAELERQVAAATMARDLVNTPANDLGPDALEAWVRQFAVDRGADISVIAGDALLAANLPMIHAVGRASVEAPRLVDVSWGDPAHPRLTLVGKGVTFDTGGLNIKPGSSMALMKKDMGGAANVLGLAHAIIDARLPVRLRVLLPIVENAISGSAFRPGDILPSRKGLSVEIGNTDAEGRLILADALTLADEERPDLIIDLATLTGAARAALGPELPAFYARADGFAQTVLDEGLKAGDPLWRMPLWAGYDRMLRSNVADLSHISSGPFAGSITAALFLNRFVDPGTDWAHGDIFAWSPEARPGRPVGGTDQAIRALYGAFRKRYGS
ncbi:leucyl aminopeptidase family protein [Pelagibacterium montanilacus]|uniref:leucyl aminopeptidase family protein n=1 Tax=Pelagibacterium montanilacus TaxID=2185280 RepID=UPI001FE8D9FF|nr:leucyl aminopeptidase family protein [Pelagibacterium montanilacus]